MKSHEMLTFSEDLMADIEEQVSREERVLLYLLKHPLQRIQDLALALSCHPSSISCSLAHLGHRSLVERLTPANGRMRSPGCYHLTSIGIEHVATLVGAVPAKLAALWEADEAGLLRLLPRLPGRLLVQNVLNGLVEQASRILPPAGAPDLPLRWHWQWEYQPAFVAKNKRMRAQVDAALVFARPGAATPILSAAEEPRAYWCAFVLVDDGWVGNNDLSLMKERLTSLLRFRESAQRWAHYHQFPPVLVLTTSSRNQDHWQRSAQEAARQVRLAPLQGAVVTLSPEDSLISSWHLPWQQLAGAGPTRLHDLFVPMPREAVPQGLLAPKILPVGLFTQEVSRASRVLVKGEFHRRAQQPFERAPGTLHVERERIAWVGLQLTHRQEEILMQLYAHPLLSPREVAALLSVSVETLMHYLSPLRRWGCVTTRPTERGERLLLGERGIRWMAAREGMTLTHIAQVRHRASDPLVQRGIASLQQTMRHTAGIYRFMTHLHQTVQEQGHHLLWWETGARCAKRYRHRGAWHNLLPDARLAYAAGEETIQAWLEWDEGTMRKPGLAAKLHAYALYVSTRQWRLDEDVLPILLMVVPDPGQEQRVQRVATTILQDVAFQISLTTATRLERQGPLAPIWWLLSPRANDKGTEATRQCWLDLA